MTLGKVLFSIVAGLLQQVVYGQDCPSQEDLWAVSATGAIIDCFGRERLFRGVNVIYKSAPYFPKSDGGVSSLIDPLAFGGGDAQFLSSIGLNTIRLGVMWPGLEPVQGEYNGTYINEIRKIIRLCAAEGIFVILDFHQDALGEMFCGEGIPYWAQKNLEGDDAFPVPVQPKPYEQIENSISSDVYIGNKVPSESDCAKLDWSQYLNSKALAENYRDLYTNGRNLRDALIGYWTHIAKEFKGEPNVIGVELMNEPSPYGEDTDRLLQEFYDQLAYAIRDVAPKILILFEPTIQAKQPGATKKMLDSMSFLHHAPGGSAFANKSVFTYHYYTYGNPAPLDEYIQTRSQAARRMKVGQLMGEFSLLPELMGKSLFYELDIMDAFLLSWTGWTYKSFVPPPSDTRKPSFTRICTGCRVGLFNNSNVDGSVTGSSLTVNWEYAASLARTYAEAVQGKAISMLFDTETSVFELKYTLDNSILHPTIVYANVRDLHDGVPSRYEAGIDVLTTPADCVKWNLALEQQRVIISATGCDKQTIVVTVKPKMRLKMLYNLI